MKWVIAYLATPFVGLAVVMVSRTFNEWRHRRRQRGELISIWQHHNDSLACIANLRARCQHPEQFSMSRHGVPIRRQPMPRLRRWQDRQGGTA